MTHPTPIVDTDAIRIPTCMDCGREPCAILPMTAGAYALRGRVCMERNRAAIVARLADEKARRIRLPWVLDPRYGLPGPGWKPVTPQAVLYDLRKAAEREEA